METLSMICLFVVVFVDFNVLPQSLTPLSSYVVHKNVAQRGRGDAQSTITKLGNIDQFRTHYRCTNRVRKITKTTAQRPTPVVDLYHTEFSQKEI